MNRKINTYFIICLLLFSMFPVSIASATPIIDSNNFEYMYVGDGLYQISKNGESTYLGFAISGTYNGNFIVRSFNDFAWNAPFQSSTDVYDIVDASGNWKTQFDFTNDVKITNEITNAYPQSITNAKFYYVMSVDVGDKIRIGKEVRTVQFNSNYHITNSNYNLNKIVPQMVVNNIGLNYQDLLDNNFDITDLYLRDGDILGYPNQKVIAVGFTKGDGIIESGQTVVIDPTIEDGMTGTTTTTLTGLSGNQSISVPNGSSYDLNITNNQVGVWASTDGRNYTNKSIVTMNGSMVTTETGIPLQLFTNLEGVNGTGDIGIAYTNLTAIPREIEYVWDNDNVSLYFPFNTTSGVDSQFVVLWGSNNNTKPAADSAYGSQAVWDNNYKAVYHMNHDPSGVAPQLKESTSNSNDCTSYGSMISDDLVDSEYGKGIDFDGNDYFISKNVIGISGANTRTVFAKIKSKSGRASHNPITFFGTISSHAMNLFIHLLDTHTKLYGHSADTYSTNVLANGVYATVGYTYDGSNVELNINGNVESAVAQSFTTSSTVLRIGHYPDWAPNPYFEGIIDELRMSNEERSHNYIITTHNNLNNPTATGTAPFYKSIGTTETVSGTTNITASVTGDNNTQSYNTSQSREFTLTPTGATNNVLINTTSTDYDVTVTTYWTENTTLQTETATDGYAKQYINYTPSFNITSADLNTTFTFNFSAQDYIGTATSTLNDVSKTTTRDGQDVNASVGSLTEATPYWWNVTVPYNNVPTVGTITNQTAYLGIAESFTAPSYSDPEGLAIDTHYWQFGDGNTSSDQNPTNTYTSIDTFSANYTVTETATVSPQAVLREFTVDVEVQPPQNVTTVPHQTNVSINWDDYAYADKYSVYELEDGVPYVDTNPTVDGVKDAIYDYAHEFLIFSPNPVNLGDYETSYPVRTALGAYFFHEAVDNDDKLGDDDLIYYFDPDNDGLSVDDPAWKITNNIVKKYLWNGGSWQVTGVSDAVGASTGGSTHYPKHELFIPIAELGANWTNGSTVKVLVKREDSSLSPDVVTWYPYGNINDTDTSLWQEMVLNDPESYNLLANVTLSNYTATNLTPFTIYHGAVSSWNGSHESSYTLFDVITEDIPVYNVSGYVFDDFGNTIAGAIVYSCNGFVHEITQTDIYGYWIGYNFREGNYTICANKSGYADNSIDIYVSTNLTNQNITLTAFEMTDWMLWEKLLEIEDLVTPNSTVPTTPQPQNAMPLPLFIAWTLILIGLVYVAYPKRDDVDDMDIGIKNITASFISVILAFTLGKISINGQLVQTFSGMSEINTVVIETSVIQIGWLGSLFTFIGIIMVILTILLLVSEYKDRYGDAEDE